MRRVLAIIEAPEHVCYRYRLRAYEPALNAAGWELRAEPLSRGVAARVRQLWRAGDHDAVILQRKLLTGWQFELLRKRAKRLLFDFDDAVLYRDSHDSRGPVCARRARRFSMLAQGADLLVAGNSFLAGYAARAGALRVKVIPTCVEPGRYEVRDHRLGHRDGRMELVWVGSSSTLKGMEQAGRLWDRLGRDLRGLSLKLVSDRFASFGAMPIHERRWRPSSEFEDLAGSDVGVSWVPDDLWSRGKCGLKILQYQAAGLPVVTNPVGVHREMVQHGKTGFLATEVGEWLGAMRILQGNLDLRIEMGQAARVSVARNYSVTRWSRAFVEAVTGEVAGGGHEAVRGMKGGRGARAGLEGEASWSGS